MKPAELQHTIDFVETRIRNHPSIRGYGRNNNANAIFPEDFGWEITGANRREFNRFIMIDTSFQLDSKLYMRPVIYILGVNPFRTVAVQSCWMLYLSPRPSANPFLVENLKGTFSNLLAVPVK
jgi:hypothetical protein